MGFERLIVGWDCGAHTARGYKMEFARHIQTAPAFVGFWSFWLKGRRDASAARMIEPCCRSVMARPLRGSCGSFSTFAARI